MKKTQTANQKEVLDELINELVKDQPNLKKVKSAMAALDLEFSDDPIVRLNTVLMALHTSPSSPERNIEP